MTSRRTLLQVDFKDSSPMPPSRGFGAFGLRHLTGICALGVAGLIVYSLVGGLSASTDDELPIAIAVVAEPTAQPVAEHNRIAGRCVAV